VATVALASGSFALSSAPRRGALTSVSAIAAQGRDAFERSCAQCHGKGPSEGRVPLLAGTYALSLKYRNGELPAALEDRKDLTPELLESVVRYGIYSMPPLRKTEVSDQELKAIAAYLKVSSRSPGGPIATGPNQVRGNKAK